MKLKRKKIDSLIALRETKEAREEQLREERRSWERRQLRWRSPRSLGVLRRRNRQQC
jgi:hypothetical protein